jgi:DNA-binding MarR family transcriptional regulator
MVHNERIDRSPVHLLHRAGQCAADIFAAEITVPDLTARQLVVLVAAGSNEGASQTDLTAATGIDRSTMADIVQRLQRKGLLQRRRTREDARTYAVKLTDQGRRALEKAGPAARRVDERVLGALPAKQREAFMAALTSIVETLQSIAPVKDRRRRAAYAAT